MKRLITLVVIVLLVAAGVAFRAPLASLWQRTADAVGPQIAAISDKLATVLNLRRSPSAGLTASGTIEASILDVASPTGGRVAKLHVSEGQRVAAGDLIAEMDTALLDADIAAAQAAHAVATAQVAQLKAGARGADLDVALAAVSQAEAARGAAKQAAEDAAALVSAPGELDVKIAQAAGSLNAAQEQVAAAQAAAQAADLEQAMWGRIVKSLEEGFDIALPIPGGGTQHVDAPAARLNSARLQWNLASQRTWEAHAKAVAAAAARDAARQTLADLRSQRTDPLALQAQADAAAAAATVAEAAVEAARAAVEVIREGATAEQVAAGEALADQAEAAVHALLARREQAKVIAPRRGTVIAVARRAGEVAGPGAAIIRLADLTEVRLTVYVPEAQLGLVRLGGTVPVAIDALPGQVFEGRVASIGSQAEFTPKNIQTQEERTRLVFPVKLTLANAEAALKPGMPADAQFGDAGMRGVADDAGSATGSPRATAAATQYSGTIEASDTAVAAEVSGRAIVVAACEGDAVAAGQVLVELDGTEMAARRAQAEAAVAAARAELTCITAAPQAARVLQAQAQVAQAEAALAGTRTAAENARKLRENPQELEAQINAAAGQIAMAAAAVDTAAAAVKTARVLQESLPYPGSDEEKTRRAMYDQQVLAAEASLRAAQAQQSGAQAVLAQLRAVRGQPVALDAAAHRAEGEVAVAEAAVGTAKALLAQVQAPAQEEAVAVARAKLAQAEAGLAQVATAAAKLKVASPTAGVVTAQTIFAGEIAQAGAPLLTVADLSRLKLVVYVPTSQLGRIELHLPVEVAVDAYPDRIFPGIVTRIADEAEFTPKNVQTQEERAKTVFATEVSLDNPDGLLKSGMPADATIRQVANDADWH